MQLIKPEGYQSLLSAGETEIAIKRVKDFFEEGLSSELKLRRVTAPLFVRKGRGINDDLNGVERAVSFNVPDADACDVEIVHSLAKWKRMTLGELGVEPGYGLYTDMNAIRNSEELTNIHSVYVDQWDWERVILESDRNLDFLKWLVRRIYNTFLRTEYLVYETWQHITPILPSEIKFIQSEDLLQMYPDMSSKEREDAIAKEYGAVFIIGIGGELSNGQIHDGRSPDYDDWSIDTENGFKGLNGDIIVWNPVLESSLELSSMGIRVDKAALLRQLDIRNAKERLDLYWHKKLMNDEFPLTVGGGIGQSRLCMFFLRKAHIGEVQSSVWSTRMIEECRSANIYLF
ncbi:MAG: aspartate--ammonia ligase [Bacteroidales bacterium]